MSDPRSPVNVAYYRGPKKGSSEEGTGGELYSMFALIMGVIGMMMKNKYCAWLTLFATLISIANTKKIEFDWKQATFSVIFALMCISMNYVGMRAEKTISPSGPFS